MKILHIAAIGHHAEGIGTVINNLVPKQISSGEEVRIISMYQNKIYHDLPIESLTDIKKFRMYLDSWTPDLVLFHSVYSMPYIHFYKDLLKRMIPYAIQMHGALSEENYRRNHLKKVIANILFLNKFIKKAKAIIYLSESEYDRCIVKRINPSKYVVPNGASQHAVQIDVPLPTNKVEIIYVGRISMYVKGLDKLLEAIDIMGNRSDVHFSIYGNEDDIHTERLKKAIKGKESIVEYCGGLYGDKKDEVMRKANIFILTSPSEGMPGGVLEALSYGVPCIVTLGTNMAETIKNFHAGWCCKYDADDIAKTIIDALEDYKKNQYKYRQKAKLAGSTFSWENVAIQSIHVYKEILRQN